MADAAVRQARFVVEGEALTRIARDLLLSEMPGKAWRFLKNGLSPGIGDHVCDILDGEKKLIGDSSSGIEVAKDTETASYRKTLAYIYAGRVRINGSWWRPRAEVVEFGEKDARSAMRDVSEVDSIQQAVALQRLIWRRRVGYYAMDGECVVEINQKVEGRPRGKMHDLIIFEPCGEAPFWWDELRDPADALEQFLKVGRRLDQESCESVTERVEANETARIPARIRAEEEQLDREEEEEAREAAFRKREEEIKAKVWEQAGDDFFELKVAERMFRIPRAPFEQWALHRTSLKDRAKPWEAVAPSGMKMQFDDPNHTDWVLASGMTFDEAYRGPVHNAVMNACFRLQQQFGDFECAVVIGGPFVRGRVGEEIAVVKDLHPDRVPEVENAKAIITQAGGKMAHLAVLSMERGIPVLRVEDALEEFPKGLLLEIDPSAGKIVKCGGPL
jgi:phosphohistidine swiveling domain-containing protein